MAQAQTGVKWDRYFYTGSMKLGGGLYGYANATLAAQDSGSYAESCAWLEAGGDTSKKGILVGRVLRRDSVSTPKKGLIIYELVSGLFLGYDGSAWDTLNGGGSGGSGSSSIDSTIAGLWLSESSNTIDVDTGAAAAYLLRRKDSLLWLTPYDASQTYQPIGSYQPAGTYLVPSDTTNKWVPIGTPDNNTTYTAGYGLSLSTTTFLVDSATLSLYYIRRKDSTLYTSVSRLKDSCAAIRAAFPAGGGNETLNQTVALGNTVTDQNILLNATTGKVEYLTSNSSLVTTRITSNSGNGNISAIRPATGDSVTVTPISVNYGTTSVTAPAYAGGAFTTGCYATGTFTTTGDGVTAQFNIPHGLGSTPTYENLTPRSAVAGSIHWITSKDATNIVVRFQSAPGGGSTITFDWIAYK